MLAQAAELSTLWLRGCQSHFTDVTLQIFAIINSSSLKTDKIAQTLTFLQMTGGAPEDTFI